MKKKRQTMVVGLKVSDWFATYRKVKLEIVEVLEWPTMIFCQSHQVAALSLMTLDFLLAASCF